MSLVMNDGQWKEWDIPARNEHRFEVPFDTPFTFKLISGSAEVFGCELALGHDYTVSGCKLAIFTFIGAKISVHGGPCSVEYLSSESSTANEALLNLHVFLEGELKRTNRAPRVLLIGSGRNTAARILTNYAARRIDDSSSSKPILLDLDVANGSVCFPGILSAVAPDRPLNVDESWHSLPRSQLISFFYGSTVISDNPKVYRRLCERLGSVVKDRCAFANASVVYIISPTEMSNESAATMTPATLNLLSDLKTFFEVDVVVVIGNERLHVTVNKHLSEMERPPVVLKIPKSGGVVSKDASFRRALQSRQFRSFFYGPNQEFHPFSLTLQASNVTIYRVGDTTALAPTSALPLGATRKIDTSKLTKVSELSAAQLLYSILGIVAQEAVVAGSDGSEKISDAFEDASCASMAGFVHVIDVDESAQTLTVLSPCPGAFPSKFLLLSSLKWIEK